MSTITREWLQQAINDYESVRDELPFGLDDYQGNILAALRIALASLEAEPIGAFHIAEQQVDGTSDYIKDGELPIDNGIIEVYAAPPVPVVPAALPENDDEDGHDIDYLEPSEVYALGRTAGWNACRAAMLQGKSEQPQNAQQNIPENIPGGNSPVIPDGWISCSEQMPVIGELNWRTSFPLLVTCEIGVIPAYYGFVSVNGDRHYGFMESLKYGDDNGNHPQTNEYGLISNVTHWMPLPEPPQEVNRG
ncbi:dTDP-6-deoxy-L-hexose 3-O-methyltransferase [Shigella sonnei]|uniref:DUF551 domain-containing protein n=1 Tax=Shigella sonnei TaxID=624 RepID=UPI000B9513AA|nr:DUF551 domain-containing protein [Shigella sonnei]OYI56486.1 dTDP-6-deoxy-L-hexose 3-O-methyltransferase [Shigella sonnei]